MRRFWGRSRRDGSDDAPSTATMPDEWRAVLQRRIPWWRHLPADRRERLERLTIAFADGMRWEAARDFTVTDEMRAVVGANACRLLLGFDDEVERGVRPFARVSSVLLHRSTVRLDGQHAAGGNGVVIDGPYGLHGQAHLRGPVVLSWAAVTSDLFHPRRGRNVVIHEFAHQLDMIDGASDGDPPLGGAEVRERWVAVRDREFRAVVAQRANPILDEYAGTNHAEFFAVATELFFTRPVELRDEIPDLYSVLAEMLRQDPAADVPPPRPAPRPTS